MDFDILLVQQLNLVLFTAHGAFLDSFNHGCVTIASVLLSYFTRYRSYYARTMLVLCSYYARATPVLPSL